MLPHARVAYVTDYEGNLGLWRRYKQMSKVLICDDLGRASLNERDHFVFGGDVFDKGPGDLRLAEELLELKSRHPQNVHLIIGNRDLNKIRLLSELHESDVFHRDVKQIPGPFWVPHSDRVTVAEYLADIHPEVSPANTQINRLKYILEKTMNCPDTFEFRRRELGEIQSREDVGDEEVFRSFVSSLEEGGVVRRYLENADIGVVLNDTLFVHGSVPEESIGFVPSDDNKDEPQPKLKGEDLRHTIDAREWISRLNLWKVKHLERWKSSPLWDSERVSRGGEALLAYFYTAASGPRTVTVSTFVGKDGFRYPSEAVIQYMLKAKIRRIVTGHRPLGDSPIVMREHDDFEVVMADTSFSDTASEDNRGKAISEIILGIDMYRQCSALTLHGLTADGTHFDFTLPPPGLPTLVGKRLEDGYTVNLDLGDGRYRLVRGSGRQMAYRIADSKIETLRLSR